MAESLRVESPKNDGVIPGRVIVKIGGQDFEVRPVKFDKFEDLLTAAQPLVEFFEKDYKARQQKGAAAPSVATPKGEIPVVPPDWIQNLDVLGLMQNLPGTARRMIEAGTIGVNFSTLEIDEGIDLFRAVVVVNLDFFIQRVLPALNGLFRGVTEGITGSISARLSSKQTTH